MSPYELRCWLPVEDESAPVLLLFIGIPASGKSTFYHRVLEDRPLDYVSLDALGTRAREKSAFDAALAARRSVCVDNTNGKGANWNDLPIPDKRGRAVYRVEVGKPGRDGATVLRHVFRIDDEIPVFGEDATWLSARLRGE